MPNRSRDTVTVSPPTLDRMQFTRIDAAMPAAHAPFDRDWLVARFAEGLQIRLLKPPHEGLVLFQPGKLAWRPIEGLERAVVVHDLRVAPGPLAREGAARLWGAVEQFAQYYGFALVLALIGEGAGLIAPVDAPGRGWMTLDRGPDRCGARLVGRVLQGPLILPRLPSDWQARAAALGPGLVIQTTGESAALERRAESVVEDLRALGISVRRDRMCDAASARSRAVCPGAAYAVIHEGRYVGGQEMGADALLALVRGGADGDRYC